MTRIHAERIALVLCAVAAAAIGGGCGGDDAAFETGNMLRFGNGAEPQDLDPHVVTGVTEHRVLSALFEGLAGADPATLEPTPGVAESWDVSEDGLEYTFHLREDAKWSNGDPVLAQDFLYAWERILTPEMASEYAYMLFCMAGARAFYEGEITDFADVGAAAPDDRTVVVRLEHPTPYFLQMQVHQSWFPVHKATIEKFGGRTERGTRWTRAGNLVGNGLFMLERWEPNKRIVAVRNPHYWDREAVHLDGVIFYPYDESQTEERLFRVGELHVTSTVTPNKFDVYQRENPEILQNADYLGTYYYRLNTTRPPFDDVRVRKAFALALDRDDLVRNVVRMGRKPASHFTPPDTAGYTCQHTVGYDVAEARRLLAEAGYPDGQGFPEVTLLYNTSESHKEIAETAQAMWSQALGVDVRLRNQEWKVYLESMTQLDYDIVRSAWVGDFVDPITFLECFTTDNGNNRTGWSSAAYDALIAEAVRTADRDARFAALQEAEAILLDELPIIPVYFYTNAWLQAPEVEGLDHNLLGYISFKRIRLAHAAEG